MVRRFDKFTDFAEIKEWYAKRGDQTKVTRFPNVGWIRPGVCACFLYHDQTTSVGFIHGLISNPDAGGREVYETIVEIFNEGEKYCRENQIDSVLFTSKMPVLQKMAENFGFKKFDTVTELVKEVR